MSDSGTPRTLHRRSVEHQTWLHQDGTLEIESRLIDTKAYDSQVGFNQSLPAGEPVHDMTIHILLGPDLSIRDIRLRMDSTPFDICPEIMHRFETLRGASMGRGWNALLSERFAGTGGCRHLIDLLRGMATVVFQSMPRGDWTPEGLEAMADSCYAFRVDGPVVQRLASEQADSDDLDND